MKAHMWYLRIYTNETKIEANDGKWVNPHSTAH